MPLPLYTPLTRVIIKAMELSDLMMTYRGETNEERTQVSMQEFVETESGSFFCISNVKDRMTG